MTPSLQSQTPKSLGLEDPMTRVDQSKPYQLWLTNVERGKSDLSRAVSKKVGCHFILLKIGY